MLHSMCDQLPCHEHSRRNGDPVTARNNIRRHNGPGGRVVPVRTRYGVEKPRAFAEVLSSTRESQKIFASSLEL